MLTVGWAVDGVAIEPQAAGKLGFLESICQNRQNMYNH
jgi:hypothetical protein